MGFLLVADVAASDGSDATLSTG